MRPRARRARAEARRRGVLTRRLAGYRREHPDIRQWILFNRFGGHTIAVRGPGRTWTVRGPW